MIASKHATRDVMDETNADGGQGTTSSGMAIRVFQLRTGTEFVVFFADREADLPDEGVGRELRAAARRYGSPTRSVTATILNDGLAGIIGAGVSAPLAAYLPATMKWLMPRRQKPRLDDVAGVMRLIRSTCEEVVGSAPNSLRDATFEKDADGRWHVTFSYRDLHIKAVVEPTGAAVTWEQTPLRKVPRPSA
jgi:hypothetical protein